VPVLRHASLKPSYACIKGIQAYFASLRAPRTFISLASSIPNSETNKNPEETETNERTLDFRPPKDSELIVVGDRIFTDVVLGNRMRPNPSLPGPLAIWTTRVWKKEGTFMRWMEGRLVRAVEAWSKPIDSPGLGSQPGNGGDRNMNLRRFVKDDEAEGEAKVGRSRDEGPAALGSEAGGFGRWVWERMKRS
jgi:phosphatidylglycerophosphatase GEP4